VLNAANCIVCALFGFVREREKAGKYRFEVEVHGAGGQRKTEFRNFYELQSHILFIAMTPLLEEFFVENISLLRFFSGYANI